MSYPDSARILQFRRRAGAPFYYLLNYPPRVLTPEEEAKALAQAAYNDEIGNFGPGPDEIVVVLAAQSLDDAKDEAQHVWQNEPHDGAIGYTICASDWSCRHVFDHIDNVVTLGHVRSRQT